MFLFRNLKLTSIKTSLFILLSTSILTSCSSSKSKICGQTSFLTNLIVGPNVGEDLNNSDNPFRALAIHPTDPDIIIVGSEGNGLFKSVDGGLNWVRLNTGLKHCNSYPEIYSVAIDGSNPDNMLIATNSGPDAIRKGTIAGAYKSTDGGLTWIQLNAGLPTSDVNSAYIVSGSHYVIGLGAGQSTNAGNPNFYSGGLFTAGFSASTWTETQAPQSVSESLVWQIVNKSSGLIAFAGTPTSGTSTTAAGVITSVDGGLTWTQVANPLNDKAGAYIDASQNLQTIYASLRSGSETLTFYKSTNGGSTWSNPSPVLDYTGPIKILNSDPNLALAAKNRTLVRTTDGFNTTTTVLVTSEDIAMISIAPSDQDVIYVTTKGLNVYRSTDQGQTFTLQSNIRNFINSL